MEKKTWAILIRCLNLISSLTLIAFQIWFVVSLFLTGTVGQKVIRMWVPIFLLFISILIVSSQFRYKKVVEYFKFLQSLIGLCLFNLFLASILSFEFSTLHETLSIIVSSIYAGFSLAFLILYFLKPASQQQDEQAVGYKSIQ